MSVPLRGLLLLILLFPGALQARPLVAVSIEPLAMVVRDVLGEDAEVRTLLLPGQNPHHASMTPGQARLVRDADLLVWLGDRFEPGVAGLAARRQGPALAMQDLSGLYVRIEDEGHSHDDGHQHDHRQHRPDPHLWLYPANMRLLAEALANRNLQMDAGPLAVRAAGFQQDLDEHVARLRDELAPVSDVPYLSHHDPWAYFADAFGIRRPMVISRSIEASASSRRFVELSGQLRELGVQCILAEPEGSRALLRRLCGDDCRLEEADPLGRSLAGQPYVALIEDLATRYQRCLGSGE